MRLTWRERRAINRAVAAELDVIDAEVRTRLADAELQLARVTLKIADMHLHTLKLERFLKETPNA